MAGQVPVPKDLSKVKTKVALGLTKRQLICFPLGGGLGLAAYYLSKQYVSTDIATILLLIIAFPFFLLAVYEKDGLTLEKYLKYVYLQKFKNPKIRKYKTENMYLWLVKQGGEKNSIKSTKSKSTKKAGKKYQKTASGQKRK